MDIDPRLYSRSQRDGNPVIPDGSFILVSNGQFLLGDFEDIPETTSIGSELGSALS